MKPTKTFREGRKSFSEGPETTPSELDHLVRAKLLANAAADKVSEGYYDNSVIILLKMVIEEVKLLQAEEIPL